MFARTFRSLFGRIFGFSLTSAASLLVLMIASSAESKGIQPKDSFGQIPIWRAVPATPYFCNPIR
jgi:hypothetical protein